MKNESSIIRLRTIVQHSNSIFKKTLRTKGHKYLVSGVEEEGELEDYVSLEKGPPPQMSPKRLSKKDSIVWVKRMLQHSRGRELMGNFNPYLIGELFWEQSEPWENFAKKHVNDVNQLCEKFLSNLLR